MTDDVLVHRARIQEMVGGRTVVESLAVTATKFADDAAYSDKNGEVGEHGWRTKRRVVNEKYAAVVAALYPSDA